MDESSKDRSKQVKLILEFGPGGQGFDDNEDILLRVGFGIKLRRYIHQVYLSMTFSLLIDGSLTRLFKASRGLRQGDQLPSFLLTVVVGAMEVPFYESKGN
eukprot:TRINITY_DN11324_c0_g1_i1.p1 TRINITY_DN11324_c0_g1~~TRINITY_DN11324_c0_g1_i1.p1  ORF type:complete len:101 (-),score=15.91 TRINITY_DN11324_c0_g1_i1:350-652(-)